MSSLPPKTAAKFKTPTCSLCRQRKLRCDGGNPCGPCSRTRTPVICAYVPKTVGQLRSELPKGGACITCRQRKRRCDGNYPCATCKKSSSACQYREKTTRQRKNGHIRNRSSDAGSSSSRPASPLYSGTESGSRYLNTDRYCRSPSACSSSSSLLDAFMPWSDSGPSSDCGSTSDSSIALPYSNTMHPSIFPTTSNETSYCTLNSIALPTLPTSFYPDSPPLDAISISFDLIAPLPSEEAAELFSMRALFLDHACKYGLIVSPEKRDAISRGDTSGLLVHPVLIHLGQLLGYHIVSHSTTDTWAYPKGQTEAEAEEGVRVLELLEDGGHSLVPDPLTCLQAYTTLSVYCLQKGDIPSFQEFLGKAGDVVLEHSAELGLDDPPELGRTPQFDQSSLAPRGTAQEARSAFSQLMSVDLARGMMTSVPSPLNTSLLPRLRELLATHWTDTEMNMMRAKSLLFLSNSRELVETWHQLELGSAEETEWSQNYWLLVENIRSHLNVINTPWMEVPFIGDDQVVTLKCIIIMALSALMELHALFAPTQPDSGRKFREVVEEIFSITSILSARDFQYIDPSFGICRSVVLRRIFEDDTTAVLPQGGDLSDLGLLNDTSRSMLNIILQQRNRCHPICDSV
ncbi:hypothetical protein C8J57DRAFT_162451 [Mycena rebaudengoi]|nr:hypothetical protein C8J57DRAFT_162451 [Mycena rebaudengoi]